MKKRNIRYQLLFLYVINVSKLSLVLFLLFQFTTNLQIDTISASEIEEKEYYFNQQEIEDNQNSILGTMNNQSTESLDLIQSFSDTQSNLFSKGLPKYTQNSQYISENLLQNGDFEQGQVYWDEYYLNSSGHWSSPAYIINTHKLDLFGYGYWYAYLSSNDWLISHATSVPEKVTSLSMSLKYRFVHWEPCIYGNNGVQVYMYDYTNGTTIPIHFFDADTDLNDVNMRDLSYYFVEPRLMAGHNISLGIQSVEDDPNCSLAIYLDNIHIYSERVLGNHTYDGIAYYVDIPPNHIGKTPVYRFSRNDGYGHFYTASEDEKNSILDTMTNDYDYDGISFYVTIPPNHVGKTAVYRYSRNDGYGHFYTASEGEKNMIDSNMVETYTYDGIAYYVNVPPDISGKTPVFRSSRIDSLGHFYTANVDENISVNPGWIQ